MNTVDKTSAEVSLHLTRRILALSRYLSLIAAVLPLLAVAGWIFDIGLLKEVHPALPAMQPNTALGLVLSAIAILLTRDYGRSAIKSRFACALAVMVSLLGVLTLSEYVFAYSLGIDSIFVRDNAATTVQPYPGRPSSQTAANLAILGMAVLIYNVRFVPVRIGQLCVLAVGANAIVAMTGYIFSTAQFYGFPFFESAIGMAVHTAAGFILLTAALLCSRPNEGMMTLLTSDTRSSGMARRILFTSILAPPLIGALTRAGVIAGWYDVSVQVSLFVVVLAGVILRTTWHVARQSECEELRARAAFDATQAANESLRKALDERRVFEALIANSSDFIGIADANGKPVYLNPAGRRMVGLLPDYPIENTQIPEYYTPDQRQFASDVIVKSMFERGHWQGETYFRHWRTQNAIPVSDEHFMIRDTQTGRLLGMGTVTRDMTERKRLEEELRLSEAKSSGIVSISPDAIISIDEHQRIILFNEGAEKIFGYSKTEAMGASLDILIPESYRAVHRNHVRKFAAGQESARRMGGRDAKIVGLRKNGEQFPADAAISKLEVGGKRIMTVALRDITEQKRIENEQTFLAEAGEVFASTLDYEDTLKNIARLAVRDLADFCMVDVLDEHGRLRRLQVMSRDTSLAYICDMLTPTDCSHPQLIRPVLESRQSLLIERMSPEMIATLSRNAEELQALRATDLKSLIAVPLLAHGALVGAIVLVSTSPSRIYGRADVRLAEELASRAALTIENARLFSEAQRAVRTREDVLAIVSHDLKNPVGIMALVAHLLRQRDRMEAPQLQDLAGKIQRSVDKMQHLIANLLDFAKLQSGTFSVQTSVEKPSHLVAPVLEATKVLAETRRQTLFVDVSPDLPEVTADAERIGQVLSNLLDNAVKFTPEGGTIRVSARLQGNRVIVCVSDTGRSIPSEHLSRIFDRFWQAQETGRSGSGLGLSIAKGIVEAHRGRIWAESQPGQGSSFFFTLPLADKDTNIATKKHRT